MKLKITFSTFGDPRTIEWQVADSELATAWVEMLQSQIDAEKAFNLDRSFYADRAHAESLLRFIQMAGQKFANGRFNRVTLDNVTDMTLNNASDLALQVLHSSGIDPDDANGLRQTLDAIKDLRAWVSLRGMRDYGVAAHGRFFVTAPDAAIVPMPEVDPRDLTTDIHMGGLYAVLRYAKVPWNDIEPMVDTQGITKTYEILLERGIGGPAEITSNFEILFEPNIIGMDAKIITTLQVFHMDAVRLGCSNAVQAVSEAGKLHIADLIGDFDPQTFNDVTGITKVELEP